VVDAGVAWDRQAMPTPAAAAPASAMSASEIAQMQRLMMRRAAAAGEDAAVLSGGGTVQRIENWRVEIRNGKPVVYGEIHGSDKFPDGMVVATSRVAEVVPGGVRTGSGSEYMLGRPSNEADGIADFGPAGRIRVSLARDAVIYYGADGRMSGLTDLDGRFRSALPDAPATPAGEVTLVGGERAPEAPRMGM